MAFSLTKVTHLPGLPGLPGPLPGPLAVGALSHLCGAAAVHRRHILGLTDGIGRRIAAARGVKPWDPWDMDALSF